VKAFVFEFPFPEEINTKKITNHGDDLNLINGSTVIPQVYDYMFLFIILTWIWIKDKKQDEILESENMQILWDCLSWKRIEWKDDSQNDHSNRQTSHGNNTCNLKSRIFYEICL